MRLLTSSTIFVSFGVAELLTATRSAPDQTITRAPNIPPELFRKQANDRFIGWISVDGEWTSRTCDVGGTYFQSGDYWRCCATTLDGCNAPIGCVAGSLVYSYTTSGSLSYTTAACSEVYDDPDASSWSMCNTGLMYENTADFDPVTNIFCGASPARYTYFRILPSDATSTSSESSTPSPTTPGPTNTSGPSTPSPVLQTGKKKSKAWIAGAVVGPIVGLALIGLALWFLLFRRRKNNKTAPPPPPMQQQLQQPYGTPGPYPGSPNQPPASYYDTQKPTMAPVGVASHQSWAPSPQPPTLQGSPLSQNPPQPVYGQQWQPAQGQQVYPGDASQSPPPPMQGSPPLQNAQVYGAGGEVKPSESLHEHRPFSAELDASNDQPLR